MAADGHTPTPRARAFPDGVPVLVDPVRGVTLRATVDADGPDVVEACRDPESIRWTTVPTPEGGYGIDDAREFLTVLAAGWVSGERLSWTIEAVRAGRPRFCGSIDLIDRGEGCGEVAFLLHPGARGRGLMGAALRLVRDHAFDSAGFEVLRWRSLPGNWASRRAAARAGFVFDGTVRRQLLHRGELRDGWVATMASTDPRAPLSWTEPPVLHDRRVRLRAFSDADLERIVQACADPRTRHWLRSLPRPYGPADASGYLGFAREQAARGRGMIWCIADPDDDRCLGSIGLEGLGGYARRAEIGYWAHPTTRGTGVVTAAARLVTAYAEDEGLVDSLVIRCAAGNTASRHVATAAGYVEAGLLPASEPVGDGELDDLVLYSRP